MALTLGEMSNLARAGVVLLIAYVVVLLVTSRKWDEP